MEQPVKPLISIVTPCFNEEQNVEEQFRQVQEVTNKLSQNFDFEYIYTDNCSADATLLKLRSLAKNNRNFRVLKFSRNVGVNRAIFMGLKHTKGQACVVIQADLQDPPQLIHNFIEEWQNGYDVVYGQMEKRHDNFLILIFRRIYYFIVSRLAEYPIPRNVTEFRLTSRRVVNALMQLKEDDPYIRGSIAFIGYPQKAIPYTRKEREKGKSSFNFFGLVNYAMNGLTATTQVPLRLVSIFGLVVTFFGFLHLVLILSLRFIDPQYAPAGYTTLIALITFFSGVQILSLGIIGEYIKKINLQTLERPKAFIEESINFSDLSDTL